MITGTDLSIALILGIATGVISMRVAIAIQLYRAARRRDLTRRQLRAERMFLH